MISSDKNNTKIFIIGLPRTGTTSICASFLDLGYTVAHTAYIQKAFEQAEVIADTPIFCDYQLLDQHYPNAKFILLERSMEKWVPSIKQLLNRMHKNVTREDGGFNPIIKRCFQQIFSPFSLDNINSVRFLEQCFNKHKEEVNRYFANNSQRLLTIDISQADSLQKLYDFLGIESSLQAFPILNVGGKVTAWKDIKHSLKIESTRNGRVEKLPYIEVSKND